MRWSARAAWGAVALVAGCNGSVDVPAGGVPDSGMLTPDAGGSSECSAGLDPTKSGGDLLWASVLPFPTDGSGNAPQAAMRFVLGPSGDIVVGRTYGPNVNTAPSIAHWRSDGTLSSQHVEPVPIADGFDTGSSMVDLIIGSNSDLVGWTRRDASDLDPNGVCSSGPSGYYLADSIWSDVGGWDLVQCEGGSGVQATSIQADAIGNVFMGATDGLHRVGALGPSSLAGFTGSFSVDQTGGVYGFGELKAQLDLGCGPVVPSATTSGWIARLDPSWGCKYSRALPAAPDKVLGDTSGRVFLTSVTTGSTFVTGLDAAGNDVFALALPLPGLSVTVVPGGRLLVWGTAGSGPVDLGGGALPPLGPADIVIAMLDASGHHLWSKRIGASGVTFASVAVTATAGSDVYVQTSFAGAVDFGGGPVTAAANDTVVARYSATGAHVWSRDLPIKGGYTAGVDGCGALVAISYDFGFDPGSGPVYPASSSPALKSVTLAVARFAP